MPRFPQNSKQAIDKVQSLIARLDATIQPPRPTDSREAHRRWRTKIQDAYNTLQGISLILISASPIGGDDLFRQLSAIILDAFEIVLSWMRQVLRDDKLAYGTLLSFFGALVMFEGDLKFAVLTSPCAMGVAIAFLIASIDAVKFRYDALSKIMEIIYRHGVARKILFDAVLASPTATVKTFTQNSLYSFEYVQAALDEAGSGRVGEQKLYSLFCSVHRSLEYLVSDTRFSAYLLRENYHRRYLQLLLSARQIMTETRSQRMFSNFTANLFHFVDDHKPHTTKIVLELLDMGAFHVIFHGLLEARVDTDTGPLMKALFDLAFQMMSRRVANYLKSFTEALPESTM
ncbi:hypothetical protein CC1G_13251 [Coprinopsis cinerea okayama7|uniref:Uncharacterized protein n=1 Tax=Coprinopsis cinerea (strain Okayama-7 / 130 / ATCC MYA-4618 / FGSC 9003) TaxID=240176 RepID=A8PI57_COPC7|nr:hypothetical protein CC1G_13251 [Coprinopsis cinerea okayama7\|eukprot:XP_001841519.1 hypothetical protein CC1G_13251 [Coprinopsis cinerea okayama7\